MLNLVHAKVKNSFIDFPLLIQEPHGLKQHWLTQILSIMLNVFF